MKKIAFITHSFHKITKSANVYIDELFGDKSKFEVDIFYNYEWGPEDQYKKFDKRIEGYDAVVILQLISFNLLRNINCKNIIYIPMYDYSRNFSIERWLPAAGLKILTPVNAMAQQISLIGLSSHEYKYYPEVSDYEMPNFKKVYFWNRVDKIDYRTVLKLLENYNFSDLNIHKVHDPGHSPLMPDKKDIEKYNISFTDWFNTKEAYMNHLKSYGVYIAPRPFEGGAAAFIDAMKAGFIVVAPNHAPFNEYIEDNKNGYLYDPNNPKAIDFNQSDLYSISKAAFESVEQGRKNFISSLDNIYDYIFNKEVNTHPIAYFENLEKVFEKPWFRFGNLTKKDKFKVLFRFLFAKFKSIF